ncbi:MAG TPA: HDOD domain-containing protein [Terracidiphilus sp.]|nr:HDOD domain-containing protein [Terracidiphilus sp.]
MSTGSQLSQIASQPWAHLRLPPFPQVALRVLQMANSENMQLHQLSLLISSDPAMAAEILRIVNSLAYAPRLPIADVLQAIAVMGAGHLQGLCLTLAARGYIGKSIGNPSLQGLWRHNLACATIAEQLAGTSFMDHDVAFTCGVMHDVGRLALAAVRTREYTELLRQHVGDARSILARERELFGKDHCEIGRQLVADWELPEDFESIVATHHEPPAAECHSSMPALINLSCRLADAAGFPAFPACRAQPFEELLEELPERQRRLFHPDVGTLIFEINRKIGSIEAV